MTHPKLPPIYKVVMQGFNVLIFTRQRDLSFLSCQMPLPREWAAAIIEVEWRKRAARWEGISDIVWTRFWEGKVIDDEPAQARFNERIKLISRAANDCYDIARQWRACGEEPTK